jgi:outer membrane receptor protein involved in Fe transport
MIFSTHPERGRQPGGRKYAVQLLVAVIGTLPALAAADVTDMSLEQLMQVPIVGASKYAQKQSEVGASVSVITRQEIRSFGWRTLDEALASLPGVYTTYDRQYHYLGTRGFGLPGDFNTRVLVTINGNRVNDPTYDVGPFGQQFPLDMNLVERIEFIPGPGGAVYGQNAMFAVVNVITRDGADVNSVEAELAYQRPQRLREARATFGTVLDNGLNVLLSATAMQSRGEDRFYSYGVSGMSGVAAGLDADHDREFFARIGRRTWSFDFVYGDHRKSDPTGVYHSDPLVAGQFQGDSYTLAQWQYQDNFTGDTLQLSGRLFLGRDHYHSNLSYGTFFAFPAHGDWQGGELRLLSTAVANHKLLVGLEAQYNKRHDQAVLDLADPSNDFVIAGSGYRVGLYAQDEWRVAGNLAATLGLRADRNDTTGMKLSPRAALIWQAAPQTTIKALYGRAHRAPNAYERDYYGGFAQVANPTLNGESIDTLELVADHLVWNDLTLRGSIYQWDIHDLITLGVDPASGLPQYQSGDAARARGVELSANKTSVSGAKLRASVSYQDAAHAHDGVLPNSPKVLGKVALYAPLPQAGLRVGYELRYDDARRSLNGMELGGYAVSNLHLTIEALAQGLVLRLSISNLFDKRYSQPGSDATGRTLSSRMGAQSASNLLTSSDPRCHACCRQRVG